MRLFQPSSNSTAGVACFLPPTYSNLTLSPSSTLVSSSPVQSLLMSPHTATDCAVFSGGKEEVRRRRSPEEQTNSSRPNIDFLLNPRLESRRTDYVSRVIEKLKTFFKDRNSTLIYPHLFRLLWCVTMCMCRSPQLLQVL